MRKFIIIIICLFILACENRKSPTSTENTPIKLTFQIIPIDISGEMKCILTLSDYDSSLSIYGYLYNKINHYVFGVDDNYNQPIIVLYDESPYQYQISTYFHIDDTDLINCVLDINDTYYQRIYGYVPYDTSTIIDYLD